MIEAFKCVIQKINVLKYKKIKDLSRKPAQAKKIKFLQGYV